MDGREATPGREIAVPGQESDKDFKALPADLGPEKREFTEALRAQFRAGGLSLRAFGARYHHDHTTVWRYLNAAHIPDRDFVEDVLAAADAQMGVPVTAEVQSHLYALHLAALKATSRNRYDNRVLSDRLVAETLQVQAARRQEQALAEELAQSKAKDQQLRMRLREIEAARDEDQIRHGADLVGYQAENSRLRDELHRLRERITTLQVLLDQAQARRVQAEARCEELEQSLAAIEQDAEQERLEDLRLAEEREHRRREEERALREALADLQRRSAERDAELAAERVRAEEREAELAKARRLVGAREAPQYTEPLKVRPLILDIWAAASTYTMRSGKWTWGDTAGSNSVTDAYQLLSFLIPATDMPELQLDGADNTAADISSALAPFGGNARTPQMLIGALEEYLERYTKPDGTSDFSGGGRIVPFDSVQAVPHGLRELDVVSSFALSVRLCLAALVFLDKFVDFLPAFSDNLLSAAELRAALSLRLTAALVGLLRSFTLDLILQESVDGGRQLKFLLNQDNLSKQQMLAMFTERMKLVRNRLGEAGLSTSVNPLENPELLFEIGWTWGIASDALPISLRSQEDVGRQEAGIAISAPYLYFTVQATEAIEMLSSERTMTLVMLTNDQERLATALRLRRDMTRLYWSRLARFGDSWPLEDIPWRTVDGAESDYFSLFVCSLVVQDLQQRNVDQDGLRRLELVMSELANRTRITRRPLRNDPATALHVPGLLLPLDTRESLPAPIGWRVDDFAPMLFKRTAQLAMLASDTAVRDKLLNLQDKIWNHLQERRIAAEYGGGMWDNPHHVFPRLGATVGTVSWSLTFQVLDALTTAGSPPTW